MRTDPKTLDQLPTPSLVVERGVFDANAAAMAAAWPGPSLRPGHLDPTVARHQRYWVVDGDDVVDCWPIDLRHW